MQLQTIRSFLALCNISNISKCSALLHISQQGLSRQIRSLENELGTQLFIRQPRGVVLTPQGELLRPYFQQMLNSYDNGLRSLKKYNESRARDLTLYVCPGIHTALGTAFFLKFDQEHPEINLRLHYASDPECEEALTTGKADAAFLDHPQHPEFFDMYEVVHSRLVAVVCPDHPLVKKKEISLKDLKAERCYFPDASHYKNQDFKKLYPDIYYSLDRSYISNDYEDYINLPKVLGGVALSFEVSLRNLDPDLVVIPIKEESYITLSYCLRKDQPMTIAVQAFSNYVYANVDVIEK
ncbi:MAG: LysR substrate-binding domain-containing protein [Bilifractor sp.]|jgi:DNA-binding transcriptional LysR family regulator